LPTTITMRQGIRGREEQGDAAAVAHRLPKGPYYRMAGLLNTRQKGLVRITKESQNVLSAVEREMLLCFVAKGEVVFGA